MLIQLSSAQKGGAKGAMRNRGRGGGGAGRRGGARNGEDDDDDDSKKPDRWSIRTSPRYGIGQHLKSIRTSPQHS